MICVVHQDHDAAEGWLCCQRAWGRLAGSLRQIPVLCEELRGLGYVQRDRRPKLDDRKAVAVAYDNAGNPHPVYADPVAHSLPAGPLNGLRNGARVSGSTERPVPIRLDPTDLLGPPRHGSVPVADRSRWPDDQVGYLSAATVLDFWARDWADLRGEHVPEFGRERSPEATLCRWLLDRLDWACQHFMALDEFAEDIRKLSAALYSLNGYNAARPKVMEAACPSCHLLTLTQSYPDANIECATTDCERILTPEEYAEWVRTLIDG